jgi:hypothetical protein
MSETDANVGNNESANDGIFDAIAEANHEVYASRGQLDKAAADPAATGTTGGGTPSKVKKQTSEDDEPEGDNAAGLDEQDFSREPVSSEVEPEVTPTEEPKQTETTQPEADFDWQEGLPPDPGEFTLKPPVPDPDTGLIDPEAYSNFIRAQVRHDAKLESYNDTLITKTFDAVDRILPEVKDNQALQAAIRSTYFSTLSPTETVAMAKGLRTTLDSLAGASKAAGAQSAKTSITVQKNATVESKGATQTKSPSTSKSDSLVKRLQKNDTSAFEELMGGWLEEGKI